MKNFLFWLNLNIGVHVPIKVEDTTETAQIVLRCRKGTSERKNTLKYIYNKNGF